MTKLTLATVIALTEKNLFRQEEATLIASLMPEEAKEVIVNSINDTASYDYCPNCGTGDMVGYDCCPYCDEPLEEVLVLSEVYDEALKASGWNQFPFLNLAPDFLEPTEITVDSNEMILTYAPTDVERATVLSALARIIANNATDVQDVVLIENNCPEDIIYNDDTYNITWSVLLTAALEGMLRASAANDQSFEEVLNSLVAQADFVSASKNKSRDALIKRVRKLEKEFRVKNKVLRLYSDNEMKLHISLAERGVIYLETDKINDVDGHIPMTVHLEEMEQSISQITDCIAALDEAGGYQ